MVSPAVRFKVRNNFKPLYSQQGNPYSTGNLPQTPYRPESLALDHKNSGRPTTSAVINGLLLNQQVSITDAELKQILSVPYVEFKLPLSSAWLLSLYSLSRKT